MKGGTEESRMVTALRGWRSCMSRSVLPSCLSMQNQHDWYAAVDGSYTLEVIWSLIICMAWSQDEGGIGMFRSIHGVWEMVGILTSGKYWSSNRPRSVAVHTKAVSWLRTIHRTSLTSSGHSHWARSRSSALARSCVNLCPGMKSGGLVGKVIRPARGLSGNQRSTRYSSLRGASTGRTFLAMGL